MQYSKIIKISAAGTRRASNWPLQQMTLDNFYARLKTPVRSAETLEAYTRFPKAKQDELKDVGGYVWGELEGDRRKAGNVRSRGGITLDADNIPPGGAEDILRRVDGLNAGYAVYSTRKHKPASPRLRILFPLDRDVTADEYEAIARKTAELIDPSMSIFDPTTFEPSRLMYWPSCCADSEYIFKCGDKPFICADGILDKYADWKDLLSWPQVPGTAEKHKKTAAKQQDPETKNGIVGAWCRVYGIYDVLENVLKDVYTPTGDPDRWTYASGSTSGGAIVYDGKFMYSHHATDPTSGQLCNSFDLCRLHLFGEHDNDAKPDTPVNRLPSYKEMCDFARSDAKVLDLLNLERYVAASADFEEMPDGEKPDISWMRKLTRNESGKIDRTSNNVLVMLNGDNRFKGRLMYNEFSKRMEMSGPAPWAGRNELEVFEWTDDDSAGLRILVEGFLGFRTKDAINDALVQAARTNSYNPLQDYLNGLVWDGIPRIDTVYIDYFGDEDTAYTRAVGRKSLVAAVARALQPGVKHDEMVVISGPQGTYKSTFIERIGKNWSTALMVSFNDPKAVAEIIQRSWIVEIPELSSLNKADTNTVKQLISQTVDDYRTPFDKYPAKHKRQCVFFGTTNDKDYLKDPTGNRRFWPIRCGKASKNVWDDLTGETVDQLWAEAVVRWRMGEPLILSPEEEKEAEKRRGAHTERDELEGIIAEFLERPVPIDWLKMDEFDRDMYLSGADKEAVETMRRDRICVAEIFRECLDDRRKVIKSQDRRRVAQIMDNMPGWERKGVMRFGGGYGRQKGWKYVGKT